MVAQPEGLGILISSLAHKLPEIKVVFLALRYFLSDLRSYHVLVLTDNTSVVSPFSVGAADPGLKAECYIQGHSNVGAGILSSQGLWPKE